MPREQKQNNIGYMESYFNTVNPYGIQYNNPSTRYKVANDYNGGKFDTSDPIFKSAFDKADIETKREMTQATSVSHALKIAERRDIFAKSAEIVNQDPILMQFAMSVIPALTDPTVAIPVAGVASKALGVAKASTRLSKASRVAAAGAISGATGNALSEAVFDQQGVQHDYISATLAGAVFGGSLGFLAGHLAGPDREVVAKIVTPEKDTYKADFEIDPVLKIDSEEGVPRIVGTKDVAQMDKNWVDHIPLLNKWLKSDTSIVYQSQSKSLRGVATNFFNPTISLKDSTGKTIPSTWNAIDFKRETKGVHNDLTLKVGEAYQEAKLNGYLGSHEDFIKDVSREYTSASSRQEIEAYRTGNPKEGYNMIEARFEHENPYINKAAEAYKEYYNRMLERGKEVGIKELGKLDTSKLYRPRLWNFKEIGKKSDIELHSKIKESLASHPNQAKLSDAELEEATSIIVNQMKGISWDTNLLANSWAVPKDLPFQTMLKSKKFKLDETKLGDLLDDNLDNVTGAYHYKMSGIQAIHFGSGGKTIPEIMGELKEAMIKEGNVAAEEELNAFNRLLQDIAGDLRINALSNTPQWTWTRNMTSFNSARLGGGFGGNQFVELAGTILYNGFHNLVNGRLGQSFKNAGKLLYTKDKVSDEFTKTLIRSGYMEDVLHTSRINRYTDAEVGFNSGFLENKLNWFNDKLMKFNGMRYFMGVMEDFTGGSVMTEIERMSTLSKLSDIEVKRLARWGLTPEDMRSLASDIKQHTDIKTGKFDLDSFTPENRDSFQLAISRGIDEIAIQGDSIQVPNWMKAPGPMLKLMTQFMRFPLIANEVLLRKGMSEEQSKMVASVLGSSVAYLGMKYVREQAAINFGIQDERDARYDYFDETNGEDNLKKALMESMNYNAQLGMMTAVVNAGMNLTGNEELGRDYSNRHAAEAFFGPTLGGLTQDLYETLSKASQGKLDSERAAMKAKSLLPGANLPLINEGLKTLIKENF